jgi:hypothetical protein
MNKQLIDITNRALDAKIWEFLGSNDILAIEKNDVRYYIYCSNTEIPLSIRILKGEKELKTLTSLFEFDDENKNDIENFESFMSLDCMELNLFLPVDMEEETEKEIRNQGFDINDKSYNPLFSVAEKNTLRRNLIAEEEVLFASILQALIKAKSFFGEFGKKSATSSFQPWFDSLNLKDSDKVDYIPLAKIKNEVTTFVAEPFDWFQLAPKKDSTPVIEVPQPMVEEVKKAKKNVGDIYDFEIYLLPAPFVKEEGGKPQYPYAFLLLNKKTKEIVDLQLDFDLMSEMKTYPVIILDLLSKQGKPQAIHCYSERSFNYLSGVLKGCDINMIKDKMDDEMMDFALQLPHLLQTGQSEPEHAHHHHEDGGCSCGGGCGDDCSCGGEGGCSDKEDKDEGCSCGGNC